MISCINEYRAVFGVEPICRLLPIATGGDTGLLESRDHGYFVVDMPNFWERAEMNGMLRDVREKPDKYDWLEGKLRYRQMPVAGNGDCDIQDILQDLHRSQ